MTSDLLARHFQLLESVIKRRCPLSRTVGFLTPRWAKSKIWENWGFFVVVFKLKQCSKFKEGGREYNDPPQDVQDLVSGTL